ncbi:hypothetical protein KY285_029107 [Solanum tuberosum]|nr:hypothetical protein KY285_029107 [Solanum tuberosum]
MAVVLLDRFSGGNPEGWIFLAEWYFTYLGFSQKDWLPLPSFYFDGEALIWFNGLFRNKQFHDWNHFKVKLLLQFRQWSFTRSTEGVAGFDSINVATIALPEILHAAIESDLANGKQEEATESKYASDLDGENLRPADNSKVPPEIFVASIGNVLHPTDFTSSIVLIGSNCDGDTPLEIKIDEEDYSKSFACKVFAEIPYREIDMDFKHSIPNATQVFEEKSDNCCSKNIMGVPKTDQHYALTFAYANAIRCHLIGSDNEATDSDMYYVEVLLNAEHGTPTSRCNQLNLSQFPFDPGARCVNISIRLPATDLFDGLPSQNVQVFLLGQYSEAMDTGLQNSGYVDKWFDTGQEFIIALEYERGVLTKELHSNDGKVRIFEFNVSPKLACEVLEQAMGSHVIDVGTQNKWTTLSSPTYFVCNILTTTLKNLPPTNYSSWSVDLQAHFYYFSISFIVYHTFLNLPFDPGIPDTPLYYGADKTLVTTGRFLSTYILIAALWGQEVCCLGLNHCDMWIKRRDSLLEDIGPHSADIIELEKAKQWNGHKLIPSENFKSLSVMSIVSYACIRKIGNTQSEVIFLADMVHINGLVAAKVLCFSLKYAIVVACSTQFMGGQVYVYVVLDKSFFAFEDVDNEQHLIVDDLKIILVHMLLIGTIAQFVLATIGGDCTTKIILDLNLEDKVLIEDGSIVMNGPRPVLANQPNTRLSGYVWDPG